VLFVDVVGSCECEAFLIIASIMPPSFISSFRFELLLPNTDMKEGIAPGTRGLVCIGMLGEREMEMDLRLIGEEVA
jgi:hypothetical protein